MSTCGSMNTYLWLVAKVHVVFKRTRTEKTAFAAGAAAALRNFPRWAAEDFLAGA